MSVEQTEVVDFISINKETGFVILTISDHLEWISSSTEHISVLQDKLNAYLRFVESGEIYETYPKAKGKQILIDIVGKYPPNKIALEFFEYASNLAESIGVLLRSRQL